MVSIYEKYAVGVVPPHNTVLYQKKIICVGSLISRTHILTAKLCFMRMEQVDACRGAPNCNRKKWIDTKLEPEFVKVVAGYVHTYPPDDEDNANTKKKWLDVINIKTSSSHQFAIVTLKHMIEFDFVHTLPVCLPVKAGKLDMYKGRNFIIHGWGYNKGSLQNLLKMI